MEELIRFLPGPQPAWKRLGVSTLLVLTAFGFRLGLETTAGQYGFIFFILPITLSALLFDRGTGFYAIGLSLALLATLLPWQEHAASHASALTIFALVSTCLVLIGEALHRALERAHKAERDKAVLLEELSHRVKNKFTMILAMLMLQSRDAPAEVQSALDKVGARIRVMTSIHDQLRISQSNGRVALDLYLQKLGSALEAQLGNLRPIALTVKTATVSVSPQSALAIGLIVNELVTNAYKHAFSETNEGVVTVTLRRAELCALIVEDDGKGCPETGGRGVGSRVVDLLVGQLDGVMSRTNTDRGCRVNIEFPERPGSA